LSNKPQRKDYRQTKFEKPGSVLPQPTPKWQLAKVVASRNNYLTSQATGKNSGLFRGTSSSSSLNQTLGETNSAGFSDGPVVVCHYTRPWEKPAVLHEFQRAHYSAMISHNENDVNPLARYPHGTIGSRRLSRGSISFLGRHIPHQRFLRNTRG